MKITQILSNVLRPVGFKRNGMSWLRHSGWVVIRISFQASQFGGEGYLNIALTISDKPLEKQRLGDWDALARSLRLLPSGRIIDPLLKKDLSDEEASILKNVLEKEACPLLDKLAIASEASKSIDPEIWLFRNNFEERLTALCSEVDRTNP